MKTFAIEHINMYGILLAIPSLFAFVYALTSLLFWFKTHYKTKNKCPPTLPYAIPIVGSALTYLLNPFRFISVTLYVVWP